MAQGPANPPNSGMQTAQTTPHPTTGGAWTPLTRKQKLDRHKRAEGVRRNKIGTGFEFLRDQWIPEEFKLPCNKRDKKYQSLIAAGDWLEQMQSGNDELEGILNALKDTYGLVTEGYPTSQAQVRQQQRLPPTPPLSQSPSDHQPAALFPPSFPEYGQGQLASPPPNPYQHHPPAPRHDPGVPEEVFTGYGPLAPDPLHCPEEYFMGYPDLPHDPRMVHGEVFKRMT
ncbi:hypothetical protein JMJ35_003480 [Cladonia borealis]|uniref:Uncharacterized protein n=1 Tax=Cladonia borealis TaxID=184061 RepID=A0AA39R5L8_9LECA|nr:hypothetical protein JMJ35_003480 [Cladonia borealis]